MQISPHDLDILLTYLKQMQESDKPKRGLINTAPETYHKLRAKIKKLKELILLTDEAVSDVEMNKLTERQWLEFIKCFPEEK
jgi:DNA replication initiation complex subunit (GINS family)